MLHLLPLLGQVVRDHSRKIKIPVLVLLPPGNAVLHAIPLQLDLLLCFILWDGDHIHRHHNVLGSAGDPVDEIILDPGGVVYCEQDPDEPAANFQIVGETADRTGGNAVPEIRSQLGRSKVKGKAVLLSWTVEVMEYPQPLFGVQLG